MTTQNFLEQFPTATRYLMRQKSDHKERFACRVNPENAGYLEAMIPDSKWGFWPMQDLGSTEAVKRSVGGLKIEQENMIIIYTCGWMSFDLEGRWYSHTQELFEQIFYFVEREGLHA